jgi:hypothetical protein
LRQEKLLSVFHLCYFYPAEVFQVFGFRFPGVHAVLHLSLQLILDQPFEFLKSHVVITFIFLPDLQSCFQFTVGISFQEEEDLLSGVCFKVVSVHLVTMILLQGIEHFRLKSVAVGNDGNVFVLVSQGKGFECTIVPSVQRHLLFVLSNLVKNLRKVLEFLLTSSIKDCVFMDFIENTLLSGLLHELHILENNLG